jgi:lipoate-protein ligase A
MTDSHESAAQTAPLFDRLLLLVDLEPHAAALNMALDEVLLHGAAATALLRCYRWARAAVSFGYFGRCAEALAAWPEREAVRRWTGGGIVPHGEDFTYSLIVPRACSFFQMPAAESYRAIHERLAPLLPAAALATAPAAKISEACFENAVRHDLLRGASKIAGAAQRRGRAGLLHQGSIQLVALPGDFAERLASALGAEREARDLSPGELAAAAALAEVKYATAAWLRRR